MSSSNIIVIDIVTQVKDNTSAGVRSVNSALNKIEVAALKTQMKLEKIQKMSKMEFVITVKDHMSKSITNITQYLQKIKLLGRDINDIFIRMNIFHLKISFRQLLNLVSELKSRLFEDLSNGFHLKASVQITRTEKNTLQKEPGMGDTTLSGVETPYKLPQVPLEYTSKNPLLGQDGDGFWEQLFTNVGGMDTVSGLLGSVIAGVIQIIYGTAKTVSDYKENQEEKEINSGSHYQQAVDDFNNATPKNDTTNKLIDIYSNSKDPQEKNAVKDMLMRVYPNEFPDKNINSKDFSGILKQIATANEVKVKDASYHLYVENNDAVEKVPKLQVDIKQHEDRLIELSSMKDIPAGLEEDTVRIQEQVRSIMNNRSLSQKEKEKQLGYYVTKAKELKPRFDTLSIPFNIENIDDLKQAFGTINGDMYINKIHTTAKDMEEEYNDISNKHVIEKSSYKAAENLQEVYIEDHFFGGKSIKSAIEDFNSMDQDQIDNLSTKDQKKYYEFNKALENFLKVYDKSNEEYGQLDLDKLGKMKYVKELNEQSRKEKHGAIADDVEQKGNVAWEKIEKEKPTPSLRKDSYDKQKKWYSNSIKTIQNDVLGGKTFEEQAKNFDKLPENEQMGVIKAINMISKLNEVCNTIPKELQIDIGSYQDIQYKSKNNEIIEQLQSSYTTELDELRLEKRYNNNQLKSLNAHGGTTNNYKPEVLGSVSSGIYFLPSSSRGITPTNGKQGISTEGAQGKLIGIKSNSDRDKNNGDTLNGVSQHISADNRTTISVPLSVGNIAFNISTETNATPQTIITVIKDNIQTLTNNISEQLSMSLKETFINTPLEVA